MESGKREKGRLCLSEKGRNNFLREKWNLAWSAFSIEKGQGQAVTTKKKDERDLHFLGIGGDKGEAEAGWCQLRCYETRRGKRKRNFAVLHSVGS